MAVVTEVNNFLIQRYKYIFTAILNQLIWYTLRMSTHALRNKVDKLTNTHSSPAPGTIMHRRDHGDFLEPVLVPDQHK